MAIIKKGMGSLDFLLRSPVYITKWSSFPCHMSRCQALVLSKIENIVPFPLPVHLKNSIGRISERDPFTFQSSPEFEDQKGATSTYQS